MGSNSPSRLLSVPEAAARLNVRPRRVYELISEGNLPGVVRIGRQVRLDPVALDRWIANGGSLASITWCANPDCRRAS